MQFLKTKLLAVFLLFSASFSFIAAPALASITYLYDANGNITSDGTNCYTYNENNELTQVTSCSNGQLIGQYSYDYQGNRIIQKIYQNGVLSQTIYTPSASYETTKLASGGPLQNTTYYLVNGQIAARKNPDGTKTFYHNDNLNSANILTDQNGQLVEKTTYYPFGGIQSGGTQSKFLYTGQKRDSDTGLDYYNARYYNDQLGRFTQADTIVPDLYNPQSLNRYSYVQNNPLRYTDPTGHQFVDQNIYADEYTQLLQKNNYELSVQGNINAYHVTTTAEANQIVQEQLLQGSSWGLETAGIAVDLIPPAGEFFGLPLDVASALLDAKLSRKYSSNYGVEAATNFTISRGIGYASDTVANYLLPGSVRTIAKIAEKFGVKQTVDTTLGKAIDSANNNRIQSIANYNQALSAFPPLPKNNPNGFSNDPSVGKYLQQNQNLFMNLNLHLL